MNIQAIPVYQAITPTEGPKSSEVRLSFDGSTSHEIDARQLIERRVMTAIQGLWIDAADMTEPVSIEAASGSRTTFPARSQGYVPIIVSDPHILTVSAPGGSGKLRLLLLNTPMPAFTWGTE